MRTYHVEISRDGDFWKIYVRDLDRSTQARTEDEIDYMARDLIICMDPTLTADEIVVYRHYATYTDKMKALREHYDNTDTSNDMSGGTWETNVESDPMVTTSLRLPKSVLDAVRACAQEDRVNVSVLLRNWIEQKLIEFEGEPHLTVTGRVELLETRLGQTQELMTQIQQMMEAR